ncbi:MAG: hypothetical protein ABFD86_05605 [Bryobacteraceae bacterium]
MTFTVRQRGFTAKCLAIWVVAASICEPARAARREVIKTDWNGFERRVSEQKLEGRKVRIQLADGGEIKSRLIRTAGNGVVLHANRTTSQWKTSKNEALLPRDQIRSVRFEGHLGHRGLFAGLASFGAALGVGSAIAISQDALDISEGPFMIVIPAVMVAGSIGIGVAGFLIGRATSPLAPEFLIER